MSIDDYESSEDRGQPVELYEFVYGDDGQAHLYTDDEQPVTFDGRQFNPLPIKRQKIESKGELNGKEIPIEVPINSLVADLFRTYPPGRVVGVIIRQGHRANIDDPAPFLVGSQFPVIWTGRVLESKRGDASAILTCEALSSGMRRPGLRRHYQWPCPLVLYGPRCNAVKTPIEGLVESVTGNRVTFPPMKNVTEMIQAQVTVVVEGEEQIIPATETVVVEGEETEVPVMVEITSPKPWAENRRSANFVGGEFSWSTPSGVETRGILRVEDTLIDPAIGLTKTEVIDGEEVVTPVTVTEIVTEIVLVEGVETEVETEVETQVMVTTAPTVILAGPAVGLEPEAAATAYIGCPHTFAACGTLHDNAVNYGGHPWIPTTGNPVNKNTHT